MGEFIAWLGQNGLPIDGSGDAVDSDGDGHNNWQEWRAGTVPTNSLSVLRMLLPSSGASGLNVTWSSTSGRSYWLDRSTNLPVFSTVASNLPGLSNMTLFSDLTATNSGPYFYRVGVQ
jgi:hypothetical protein